jgi:hypothetical protein
MTTSQKRSAYTPLGGPIRYSVPEKTNTRTTDDSFNVYDIIDLTDHSGQPVTEQVDPAQESNHLTLPYPHQHAQAPLRKPVPPSTDIARHISVSAKSNISGGTATSKHSVFSTPGRDELERKKAKVEPDEGPFGRAVSVSDLNERRRVVSGGSVGGKKENRVHRVCGMGVGCSVM